MPKTFDKRAAAPMRACSLAGLAVGLLLLWQQLVFRAVLPTAPELAAPLLGNVRSDVGWIVFVTVLTLGALADWAIEARANARCEPDSVRVRLFLGCACMTAASALTFWLPGQAWAVLAGGALAGVGFLWGARALLPSICDAFPADEAVCPLVCSALVQLACGAALRLMPGDMALVVLCAVPLAFGCCKAALARTPHPTANTEQSRSKAKHPHDVADALARRDGKQALVVCLVVFFFAILYTNITGFRFNTFRSGELLTFNLNMTIAKSLVLIAALALTRKNLLRSLPMAIMTLFTTSMLVVTFAPDISAAYLAADSLAAAGRFLAFAYAWVTVSTLRGIGWPPSGKADAPVICLSGACVLLSVFTGSLIQNTIEVNAGGFALVTAAVLYVLFIGSNLMSRRGEEHPVVVQLAGEDIDEQALATKRAQAVAARFPQLTERETQIVGLMLLGLTSASVAERLSISENTAKTHMRRIYQKTGVHSRQELLRLAYDTAPLRQR